MKILLTEWRNFLKEETIPLGKCYPFAVKMAKASSNKEFEDLSLFKVVHGRITDKWSGESEEAMLTCTRQRQMGPWD